MITFKKDMVLPTGDTVRSREPIKFPKEEPEDSKAFEDMVRGYLRKHEGVYTEPYQDIYDNWTMGIGHLMTDDEIKEHKGKTLTAPQIEAVFSKDFKEHVARARRIFPKFDTFSKNRRMAIIDGVFRGDLSGSPKAIDFINKGQWAKASKDYLDNREYRASKKARPEAQNTVWNRMEENTRNLMRG